MAYIKGINIVIGADTTKLDSALKRIDTNTRGLNKELREVNGSLKFDPKNTDLLAQKVKILNERYKETKERLDALKRAQNEVNEAFERGDITEEQYRQFQTDIATTESRLKGFEKQLKNVTAEYDHHSSAIGKASEKMKDFGSKASDVANKLKPVSVAAAGVLGLATKQAVEFESAFAGVEKTFPGTQAQLAKTRQEIRDMAKEIPVSTTELSQLAESAGQLGIEADAIMGFTRTIADLGVATNLAGEEGATTLARFANVTRMSQKDFDRLGSTIVELGNNSATTEREIADMALRLGSAGTQVGLTHAEILALSAGLSSVGIEAQAGGTSFSKVMIEMQLAVETGSDKLKDFADVAGMTTEDFARQFNEDAMGAILSFIEGLQSTEERGESAIKVLEEMGITEVRLRDTLLRVTNANDLFANSIDLANNAWEENTALTNEASVRYETTESKIQIMKNQLNDTAITIGEKLLPHVQKFVGWLGDLVDGFNELSPGTQDFIIKALTLSAVSAPLVGTIGKLSSGFGGLLGTLGTAGRSLGLFKTASAGVSTSLTTVAGGLGTATTASGGFLTAMGSAIAPLAPWALGIGAVGLAGYGLYKTLDTEVIPSVDMFADHVSYAYETVEGADGQLITTITDNTVVFSEETKTRLGAFFEMSEEVQRSNFEMFAGLTEVTGENVETLKTQFGDLTESVKTAINEQANKNIEDYEWLKESGITLTSEQEAEMLRIIQEGKVNKLNETENLRNEYSRIMDEIKKSGIDATQEQQTRINEIIDEMNRLAVASLTANEAEQNALFNRLGANNTRVTAEMVGDVISEYNRLFDESVAAAEDTHSEQYRIAEELRRDGSAEANKMADEIIEAADRQYTDTVEAARKTRTEGLDKLNASYGDLASQVDVNTGNIKTHWDNISQIWDSKKFEDKRAVIETEQRTVHTTYYKPSVYLTGGNSGSYGSPYGANRPGHNDGLSYVPYNNYMARLHEGERVLTKQENIQLNEQGFLNSMKDRIGEMGGKILNSIDNSIENISFNIGGTYHIREEADIEKLSIALANQTLRLRRGG